MPWKGLLFICNFLPHATLRISYFVLTGENPLYLSSGLTSWTFMVSYTHKRPLCGHCAPPLHERANQSAPFGLDFLDFHGTIKASEKDVCLHEAERKSPRQLDKVGGFSMPFEQGGLDPRLAAVQLSVQPFANVVSDYACRDRSQERCRELHKAHPLSLPIWGKQRLPCSISRINVQYCR